MTGEPTDPTPLRLLRFKLTLIAIIIAIICVTFVISFFGFLESSADHNCNMIAPLSTIIDKEHCLAGASNTTMPIARPNFLLQDTTSLAETTHRSAQSHGQLSDRDLNGQWSVSGHHGTTVVFADATLRQDGTYNLTETVYLDNSRIDNLESSGFYKLNYGGGLLYLASHEGILSAYIISNLQNDSFYAFNPNTGEAYNFLQVLSPGL